MIHIVHALGGCGGTVLSRCIGVLPGIALLSEINSASVKLFPSFDPLYQDKNWLHLLGPADAERFSQMDLGNVEAFRELVDVFHVRASEAGRHLGMAFQIVDDVLDATADSATLGKTAGKDVRSGKTTFVKIHGLEKSRQFARERTDRAVAAFRGLPGNPAFLIQLTESMAERVK